jgi:protoporphyrinogen oxidase
LPKIIILGAGPAGLGAAWQLKKSGLDDFSVYEKRKGPGGLASSYQTKEGFSYDAGGHVLFSSDPVFSEMLSTLLGGELLRFNRSSWIFMLDSLIPYPLQNNVHLLPEEEMLDCLLGAVEAFAGHENTGRNAANFREWCLSVFGSGLCRHFMLPYNSKVWAVPLELMGHGWIGSRVSTVDIRQMLKNLVLKKNESDWGPNSVFSYPLRGGIGRLCSEAARFVGERHFNYEREALHVDSRKKEVYFSSGEKVPYDFLLSTMPLNELLLITEGIPRRTRECASEFLWNSLTAVGIGARGKVPHDKHWIYFPEEDFPFYRVTLLSNYSRHLVPDDNCFSLLAEISNSACRPKDRWRIPEDVLAGLVKAGLLPSSNLRDILDVWVHEEKYAYPVPFLGRDRLLKKIMPVLGRRNILSFGRFGLWKYEEGNTDHSFLQGAGAARSVISRSCGEAPDPALRLPR